MYDDIASAPKGSEDQRRGGAGTTFIYKILGSLSEEGEEKETLLSLGQYVRDQTRTLSIAIDSGTSPISGEKIFHLDDDEVFIGMGVHGESGYGRQKISSSKKIIKFMMDKIFDDFSYIQGDVVIPFINGSGATTLMELLVIYNDVEEYLARYNIKCFKPLVNEYITTQESAGFSISLLNSNEQMRDLWASPSSAPYFHL
jgi:dihydroxyacetone kinase-like protein